LLLTIRCADRIRLSASRGRSGSQIRRRGRTRRDSCHDGIASLRASAVAHLLTQGEDRETPGKTLLRDRGDTTYHFTNQKLHFRFVSPVPMEESRNKNCRHGLLSWFDCALAAPPATLPMAYRQSAGRPCWVAHREGGLHAHDNSRDEKVDPLRDQAAVLTRRETQYGRPDPIPLTWEVELTGPECGAQGNPKIVPLGSASS
jgi:hypothetical protein